MNKKSPRHPIHPLANHYPEMSESDFEALKEDIKVYGQQVPIVLFNGKVIDGRHRLRACQELGIEPITQEVGNGGQSAEALVVSLNEHRRHLTESQRAMIAARNTGTTLGSNQHTAGMTQAEAAKQQGISKASVQRAKAVIQKGHQDLVRAVELGQVDVTNAVSLVDMPAEKQQAVIAELDFSGDVAGQIRTARNEYKREQIIAENRKKSANNQPLDYVSGRYGVVYADPPWNYMSETDLGYPTMTLEKICEMPVPKLAEDDAVLFLWCSASLMREALQVIDAWGFTFKTQAVWDKGVAGQGGYFRQQHEHLFIATRGKPVESVPGARVASVLKYPRREHSRKPDEVRELIDVMYPELSKVELFCRGKVPPGWIGWGNEYEGVAHDVGASAKPIAVDVAEQPAAANDEQPPRRGPGRPRKQA